MQHSIMPLLYTMQVNNTYMFYHLHELLRKTFMHQYYLLNAAPGKLYLLKGANAPAREYLQNTLQQTNVAEEKAFIKQLMRGL